ncbi:unnamed protein product [Owenia fusiformis]|uniref:Proteasome assembly chaperone 1 n=1 Tax=Owenia fusiformis TaxID=6347 RepID=A0A8J1XJQ5_OWEFU|nr:unnamed protein product [Owenia fusiformis]
MATFYGEIVQPYSRAVDDDDDEDDVIPDTSCSVLRWSPTAKLEMEESPTQCLQCEVLIIAIGQEATGFSQAYLLENDAEIICVICSGMDEQDVNTFSQTAPTDKTCYIYRLKSRPNIMMCMCNSKVTSEASYSWTEKVFSKLEKPPDQQMYVAVLSSTLASEFKSETPIGDLKLPFLRSLSTNEFPGTPICPYLEVPNVVPGLPASSEYLSKFSITISLFLSVLDALVDFK